MDERFELLATDAKEYAVFLIGLDGNLLCWNAGAERLFGYQVNEVIGQHFSRFFSAEDILTGHPEHELKTALAEGRADSTCWQIRKDASRFWCQSVVTPLFDEHKQARSFARVMHDLTESEAVQTQRKRADRLAEANRSKEEFMALVSHELRNPLSPIVHALHILRQMRTKEAARGWIVDQIDHLVGREAAVAIEALIQKASEPHQSQIATLPSICLLIFGATSVFVELKDSLDIIWEVKRKPGLGLSTMIKSHLLSFGIVLGTGFLLLVSLLLTAMLTAFTNWLGQWLACDSLDGVSLGLAGLIHPYHVAIRPDL